MTGPLVGAIRLYQRHISPMMGPRCRYHPTCSSYALTAIRSHGALRGLMLGSWRILRCNPWSHGGYDPVPERQGARAATDERQGS